MSPFNVPKHRIGMFVVTAATAFAIFALSGGCALTGTWRTVSVVPEDARFPIQAVTFHEGRFTASARDLRERHTSTGHYKWNGSTLLLVPAEGPEQAYRGRRRLDGTLVLSDSGGDRKVKAVLERVGD